MKILKYRWCALFILFSSHAHFGGYWYSAVDLVRRYPKSTLVATILIGLGLICWQQGRTQQEQTIQPIQQNSRIVRLGEQVLVSTVGISFANTLHQQPSFSSHISKQTKMVCKTYSPGQFVSTYIGDFDPIEQRELDIFCNQEALAESLKTGSGILLSGFPGSGKTALVHEFACRSKSMLFEVNTALLNTGFAGDGAAIVSEIFAQARRSARQGRRVIIFFDELDIVGTRDSTIESAAAQSQGATLGSLLLQMNTPLPNIMIFGATNRVGDIDPALLRSGRIDTIIEKALPDRQRRRDFIQKLQEQYPCLAQLNSQTLAEETDACSYGDLKTLCKKLAQVHAVQGGTPTQLLPEFLDELYGKKSNEGRPSRAVRRERREEKQLTIAQNTSFFSKVQAGIVVTCSVISTALQIAILFNGNGGGVGRVGAGEKVIMS